MAPFELPDRLHDISALTGTETSTFQVPSTLAVYSTRATQIASFGSGTSVKDPTNTTRTKGLHAIIGASAPVLSPRLWYGMPAYAKDGKVVCFFQGAQNFETRYATFGFHHEANLDEGAMWPVAFAVKELTATEEADIAALVRKAVS
jgi:uncharacterized protein YdhG (YjbR/CyaY superfamily)